MPTSTPLPTTAESIPEPLTKPSDIDPIVHSCHWDPFSILGPHEATIGKAKGRVIRAFLPEATEAWVVDLAKGEPGERKAMTRIHPDGFFELGFPGKTAPFPYRLAVVDHEGHSWDFVDAYQFGPVLTDFDLHLLGEGTHYKNYESLGAHLKTHEGFRGVHFAVWAPNAERVSVVGNFNHWDGRRNPMRSRGPSGIWEIFVPDLSQGEVYKFEIKSRHRQLPRREGRPLRLRGRAPAQDRVRRLGRHPGSQWHDDEWMKEPGGRRRQGSMRRSRSTSSTSALWRTEGRGRWPVPHLSRAGRPWSSTSDGDRIHPHRADADQRAPPSTGAGATSRSATSPPRRGIRHAG